MRGVVEARVLHGVAVDLSDIEVLPHCPGLGGGDVVGYAVDPPLSFVVQVVRVVRVFRNGCGGVIKSLPLGVRYQCHDTPWRRGGAAVVVGELPEAAAMVGDVAWYACVCWAERRIRLERKGGREPRSRE